MKNVIIYTRVSSDDQALNTSLGDQKEKLENFCAANGYNVLRHFQDDFSAKTFDRPAIREFLKYANAHKGLVDGFLTVRWDRFSRNVHDSYVMLDTLNKMGIEVLAIEQPIDMSIPENRVLLAIYLTVPEVENIRRGKNTFNGIRKAKKEGRYCSTAPYGYKYERESGKKPVLAPDAKKAPLVLKAFELYATGLYSKEEIRRILAKQDGAKLTKYAFSIVFHNPLYCGKVVVEAFEKEPEYIVQGIHAPIVSEELYGKVQQVHNRKKQGLVQNNRVEKNELPLRGFLQCPDCGRKWTGSGSKSYNGQKFYYYHCLTGCKARVSAKKANAEFEEWLLDISIKPEYVNSFLDIFDKLYKSDLGDRKILIGKTEAQIRAIEEKGLRANMLFVEGDLDKAAYQNVKATYQAEITELNSRIIELRGTDKNLLVRIEKAFSLISNLQNLYIQGDTAAKKRLLNLITPSGMIYENGKYRTAKDNEIVELMSVINSDLQKIKSGQNDVIADLSATVARSRIELPTLGL